MKVFCGRLFRMLATVALISATTAQLARATRLPEDRVTRDSTATAGTGGGSQTSSPTALSPSSSGALTTAAGGCAAQTFEQPFLRWLDPANYVLPPNGSLESTTGWMLTGAAKLVSGNESFRVHSSTDSHALSLPSGSSATTKPMCVGTLYPTLRFFVLNSGSLLSTLKVEAIFPTLLGKLTFPVGVLPGLSNWQPTLPLAYLGNFTTLPVLTNGTTSVQFRFTPLGSLSGWRIDDVYVDPFKGR